MIFMTGLTISGLFTGKGNGQHQSRRRLYPQAVYADNLRQFHCGLDVILYHCVFFFCPVSGSQTSLSSCL